MNQSACITDRKYEWATFSQRALHCIHNTAVSLWVPTQVQVGVRQWESGLTWRRKIWGLCMMIRLPRNPRTIKLYISWINPSGVVSLYMLEALSVNGGKNWLQVGARKNYHYLAFSARFWATRTGEKNGYAMAEHVISSCLEEKKNIGGLLGTAGSNLRICSFRCRVRSVIRSSSICTRSLRE